MSIPILLQEFDDKVPKRMFDNLQFLRFEKVPRGKRGLKDEDDFALMAMMEIPQQYKAACNLK